MHIPSFFSINTDESSVCAIIWWDISFFYFFNSDLDRVAAIILCAMLNIGYWTVDHIDSKVDHLITLFA